MRVLRTSARADSAVRPAVVALGNFDGMHRGHQAVLCRVVELARACGGVPAAVTFYPDPARVVSPGWIPRRLGTVRQRLAGLAAVGIEVVVLQHFTAQFAALPVEQFVRDWLIGRLQMRHIVVGPHVALGHRRTGNAQVLAALGRVYGFAVDVVNLVEIDGRVVTSEAIRTLIAQGDLRGAAAMLGRGYRVNGRVVHGHHRGRLIGFPTANLRLTGMQLPPDGVYAVMVWSGTTPQVGVANIGFNPTFGDAERAVEVHLLDFSGDLYGRRIEVEFVEHLRGERKFPDVGALARQIGTDIAAVRRLLLAR